MSLRLKMVLVIAGLIAVLGIGGTVHARLTLSGITDDELDKRAVAISQDLANGIVEPMLTNDMYRLYHYINQKAMNNDGVRYVVVFDDSGAVRASTFVEGLPAGLRQANVWEPGEPYSLTTVSTSDGPILDAAFPLGDGKLGVVRVGITKQPMQSQVNSLSLTLIGLAGIVLVVGIVMSYILATFMTRPLTRLAEAARAAGRGEPSSQAELYGHPEVGQVAVAFDVMTHQLKEKEEERSQLLAKIIGAQEEERKRIARELHDEAGQLLTSLLLGLTHLEQSLPTPDRQEEAANLKSRAAAALDLMKDMALELRPSTLDDLGLVAAVDRYAADFGRKYGIDADFHSVGLETTRLQPQTETALYRIVQEALTNVAKHAHAQHVSVLLEGHDNRAVVVVEDDGQGFDVDTIRRLASPARKLGLLGIEERAALVGGTLTIESRPHAGTALFVAVPMTPERSMTPERNGHDPHPDR